MNLGSYERNGQMWYTCKCGVSSKVFVLDKTNAGLYTSSFIAVKVIQIVIMHDIKDGLAVVYHCDNDCSYTETLNEQNLVHRHLLDAKSAIIQLNRKLVAENAIHG